MASLIRATNLWGFPELVRELGGDPQPLLKRFQIPIGIEREPDAFALFRSVAALLSTTADDLSCPDLGLRLSRWQGLDILGPVAVIARNARTVREGLVAVARYLYVHSPALKLELVSPSERGLAFTYEITERGAPDLRQAYELSMGNAARIISLLAGPDARFDGISFLHEQIGPSSAYDDALGCPVRFGQARCGFEVSESLARREIDSADPETRRIATRYLETEFLPHDASLSDQVTALSRRLLPVGHCTTEVIAEQLAMHPRTLQRRLAAEGVRCQDVIDEERRRQAVRYLAEPRFYLGQVAGMLGFAEQSSLNRACLRWFGKTPRQYRADLLLSG
jgi:AraC-like DNA-binding protein